MTRECTYLIDLPIWEYGAVPCMDKQPHNTPGINILLSNLIRTTGDQELH